MTWDDVDDILFDGSAEEIKNVRCPDCGGELMYEYFHKTRNMEIECKGCFTLIRAHGAYKVPNFALLKARRKVSKPSVKFSESDAAKRVRPTIG